MIEAANDMIGLFWRRSIDPGNGVGNQGSACPGSGEDGADSSIPSCDDADIKEWGSVAVGDYRPLLGK